jgi:hypothetical protein
MSPNDIRIFSDKHQVMIFNSWGILQDGLEGMPNNIPAADDSNQGPLSLHISEACIINLLPNTCCRPNQLYDEII